MNSSWILIGLLPYKRFLSQEQTVLLKVSTHGDVHFMSWVLLLRQRVCTNQVITPLTCRDISWSITISCIISSSSYKPRNWACLASILVVFNGEFSTVPLMKEVTIPLIWTDLVKRRS